MKYYCIEFEDCGFSFQKENWEELETVCPACWSLLLAYEDHIVPSFLESIKEASYAASSSGGLSLEEPFE